MPFCGRARTSINCCDPVLSERTTTAAAGDPDRQPPVYAWSGYAEKSRRGRSSTARSPRKVGDLPPRWALQSLRLANPVVRRTRAGNVRDGRRAPSPPRPAEVGTVVRNREQSVEPW